MSRAVDTLDQDNFYDHLPSQSPSRVHYLWGKKKCKLELQIQFVKPPTPEHFPSLSVPLPGSFHVLFLFLSIPTVTHQISVLRGGQLCGPFSITWILRIRPMLCDHYVPSTRQSSTISMCQASLDQTQLDFGLKGIKYS